MTTALPVDSYSLLHSEPSPVEPTKRLCKQRADDSVWGCMALCDYEAPFHLHDHVDLLPAAKN